MILSRSLGRLVDAREHGVPGDRRLRPVALSVWAVGMLARLAGAAAAIVLNRQVWMLRAHPAFIAAAGTDGHRPPVYGIGAAV